MILAESLNNTDESILYYFQNLGTIKCSNLCTEIVEYTSPDEVML